MRLQRSGLDKVVICSLSFLFQISSITTSKYKVASGGISPAKGAAARTGRLSWDRHGDQASQGLCPLNPPRTRSCLGLLATRASPWESSRVSGGGRTPHSWGSPA